MKAISCPQCGALVREITDGQRIIKCVYCGAKILVSAEDKTFPKPRKSPEQITPNANIDKSGNNTIWNSPFSDPYIYGKPKPAIGVPVAIGISFAVFSIFIAIIAGIASGKKAEPVRNIPTPKPFAVPTPPPMPVINIPKMPELNVSDNDDEDSPLFDISYRVSWDSSIPEQHIELPTLKDVDFPSSDLKTLQKTVFAQKIIRVKVKINTNGEVTEAKAISGHKILKDAAENAARASYFSERKKPLDTVMVYHFQIKQIE